MSLPVIQWPESDEEAHRLAVYLVDDCGNYGTQVAGLLCRGVRPIRKHGFTLIENTDIVIPHDNFKVPTNFIPAGALSRLGLHLIFRNNHPFWASTYVLHMMCLNNSDPASFWGGMWQLSGVLISRARSLCDAGEVWRPDIRDFVARAAYRFGLICGKNQVVDQIVDYMLGRRPWEVPAPGVMFSTVVKTFQGLEVICDRVEKRDAADLVLCGTPIVISDADCVLLILCWLFSAETNWIEGVPEHAPDAFRELFDVFPVLKTRNRSFLFLE